MELSVGLRGPWSPGAKAQEPSFKPHRSPPLLEHSRSEGGRFPLGEGEVVGGAGGIYGYRGGVGRLD